MATIVDLNTAAARRRADRSEKRERRYAADVVLFPGVRYERGGEATTQGRTRTGRKRDRLDLED